uniref:Disco interacting protein 2 homolog B n=1 Tax=Zosterops lateralis melanops TaxID=1220523 RepID=A0A8D2P2U4_ZOSLA
MCLPSKSSGGCRGMETSHPSLFQFLISLHLQPQLNFQDLHVICIHLELHLRLHTLCAYLNGAQAAVPFPLADIHTEAVQAALAKHKEQKMALPMPTKRRSTFVQSPADACTPPDTSSASEDEGSLRRQAALSAALHQSLQNAESWINRSVQGSSTSSSASSTLSHGEGKGTSGSLADVFANTRIGRSWVRTERSLRVQTGMHKGSNRSSLMDTADGVPVSSRVSTKIQQLLNTLKRPKRPPLKEFFVDDFEEIVEVPQPDPNQPKPEGRQMTPVKGEPLGVVCNWPPALEAALQRWGTTQAKCPCLTALDVTGKPVYTLTYGKLWSRSLKLAYTLLNKLGTKNEPVLKPGDRVALVYPNNDPVMFMVAFYGCLLAEVIPVPIEVPLTRKDAGGQQIGFLLGSCGIALALTTEVCLKGLPKTQNGEIVQFKGWPRLKWVVTDSKYLSKSPKDWQPNISAAGTEPAYIEYKTSKEGSVMGVTVSRVAMLAHCQALSQACNYSEGETIVNVLDFKKDAGLWHGILTSHGLKPEAICPCATSPEIESSRPGRAILSMNGLSFGVIRVNTEDKNSALTVQDVGHVMPGGMMCIVKPDGPPQLCKTDEIGEICVSSRAGGMMYYGLAGVTKNTFEVIPVNSSGSPVGEVPFVRSGLLGFVGPGSLVFVVGKMDGLLTVSGRRHNADDIVATGLAVESIKTVYRGRIAVFSVSVFYDERIVVVAEQRPDASEEDSFQWMSRVLQVQPDCLHCVGPASVMVGNLVAGKRIAQASGRDLGQIEDNDMVKKHQFLTEMLQWRAQTTPDHPLFLLLNAKGTIVCTATCLQLHKKAERIASVLCDKGHLNAGDNVVLLYPPGIELITAFYGCLYSGCVPVTVRPPHAQSLVATLPTVRMIVEVSDRAACILTTQTLMRLLKSREAAGAVDVKTWPTIIDTDDLPRKRLAQIYKPPTPEMLAYLDFSVSTTGMLTGVKMSHAAVSGLCRAIKLQCELYSSRQIAICLDPYCGLGFVLWCLCSVYSGHQSILIPPMELESNLFVWLSTVSQYKIRDTFCSYSVMEMCTKGLGNQVEMLKARGINLSCVRTCVVVAEERPRVALTQSFSKLFKDIGLSSRAVSTTFGSRVNVAICLQGTSGPDPTTVYVDLKSLRHDRVRLVERGAPQSLLLSESGKILPGVKVVIVNPETKGPLGDSHLGEIWVNSPHTASGYYTIYDNETLQADHFNTRLSFGDAAQTLWARTGYLGFVRRTELTAASGERHDALYVVGALDETLELRGLRYHPIDIETSVSRTHRSIAECAVFTWTNLLVVVVELCGCEQEALDLVPLVTNVVLEEHYLIVGVVVVVDPGVIPINSRGEKQRMHLRDSFLADQLDPIYVAYNM